MTDKKQYCSVYGCLNSRKSSPELTFFKLPAQPKRLSEWLRLIDRGDIADKAKQSSYYRVCEIHFREQDVLPGTKRKILKKNALPSKNLPDVHDESRKEDKETQVELIQVDDCTQTRTTMNDSTTQTPVSLSSESPRIRKLKSKLSQYKNRLKFKETGHDTQESTFHKLCDKFLTKNLAKIVKAQTRLKFHGTGNRYDHDYMIFCMNLHFTSPQAYRLLQTTLCLPTKNALRTRHSLSFTTEINEKALSILKIKVAQMTETEKNCSVMIDAMNLKTNLFYDIKNDKIIGFHEVEGWQSPQPAKNALVIMVRGIFENWKQPVAYALLSECRNSEEITEWVDHVLEKLFDVGLNIRTFVSAQGSDLLNAAKKRSVSVETPYFVVNDRKIYYIFDAPHLIKSVRNNLMQYDFHFGNFVAKYEHIVQFFDRDITKSCRLAHKLTTSHIKPTNFEKMNVRNATQLLSKSVASGIFTYADFNIIEESGRGTADLIMKMNDLFDALNSSHLCHSYEYKRAYKGTASQKAFFRKMLDFFQALKLVNPKNGYDCTSKVKFIEGFQITIKSIMFLFEDLLLEGYTFLLTRRLNQDGLENLFGQLRTRNGLNTNPTSRQFQSAFKQLYFSNVIKPPKGGNCDDDLGKLLVQKTLEATFVSTSTNPDNVNEIINTDDEELDSTVQIKRTEYNDLEMPEKNSLFYICVYLLKRCDEKHLCESFKSYIKPFQRSHNFSAESRYLRYRDFSKNNYLQSYLIVPRDDLVEYLEKLEETFRTSFEKKHINCRISASLYKQMKDIAFSPPCTCFPKTYFIKLFIRMRIFYTLKFNNRAFRTSQKKRKYFSVANL